MVLIKNNNYSQLLIKYSDALIISHFQNHARNSNQFTLLYKNDPVKIQKVLNNIIQRHIAFRDALIDPQNNIQYIEAHSKYFWDPLNTENAQLRGPQTHLSHQMFSDFGFAGNGIQNTHLTGLFLGTLKNTIKSSSISYPKELISASPHSFRQSMEIAGGRMHSSMTGHHVHITNDDPLSVPYCDISHNNMPKGQRVNDYFRIIEVVISQNTTIVHSIKEDAKEQAIDVATDTRHISTPRVVLTGSVDLLEEKVNVRLIAQQAIMGRIPVTHFNKLNTHEVPLILNKIAKTGKIEDANELVGFPFLVSNRHNDI